MTLIRQPILSSPLIIGSSYFFFFFQEFPGLPRLRRFGRGPRRNERWVGWSGGGCEPILLIHTTVTTNRILQPSNFHASPTVFLTESRIQRSFLNIYITESRQISDRVDIAASIQVLQKKCPYQLSPTFRPYVQPLSVIFRFQLVHHEIK